MRGFAEIVQPYREELFYREGFFQGSVVGAVANFAAGAAAGSLLPEGWENATVDYTVKVVAPGAGEELVARGSGSKRHSFVPFTAMLPPLGKDWVSHLGGAPNVAPAGLARYNGLEGGEA